MSDMLARSACYWKEWLADGTKKQFSPQPYQMIARLLRDAGYPGKANAVLYAARRCERGSLSDLFLAGKNQLIACKNFLSMEPERNESIHDKPRPFVHALYLWISWATIGFGIGKCFACATSRSLFALTIIGTAVLDFPTKCPLPTSDPLWKIAASLDRLIPFAELVPRLTVTLSESLNTWQTLYFAAHSLLGWVLAAMVVAGLAGLTQKA